MLANLAQAEKLLSEVIDAELYAGKAREVVEKYYDKLRKDIYCYHIMRAGSLAGFLYCEKM